MRTFQILATSALAATAVGANRCPVECTAFDKFGAKATDASAVHHMAVTHSTIHATGAHGPAAKHADCKTSVGGCTDAKLVPHKCSYNAVAQTCQCTCLRVAEATTAATQAPKKAGEMVVEHKVTSSMKLENLPLESFTESAQLGVRIAIAKAASVHRDDVTLANVRSLGGRRLAEAISAAAGGVAFDVVVAVYEAAQVSAIKAEVLAVVEDAPTAAAFAKNVVAEMVAIVSLDKLVDEKIVAALSAAAVTLAPPSSTETKIKAGCYVKAHSCPNHKWATGKWSYHSHGSKEGKAFCLAQAVSHHNACGGDVMDPWSQKWVDHEGEVVETYPKPGCYWKLTSCPNHPGWLTTPKPVKVSGGNSNSAKNLQACTGECDSDAQCATGLKCFQRQSNEAIPGCDVSSARRGWDYCYDPNFGTEESLSSNWKKHSIDDQARCIGSAWSHHKLCGLPERELSATMFIGDENSDDATKATTHAVSCGVHQVVKLPAMGVSMSSTHGPYAAQRCVNGETTSTSRTAGLNDLCHGGRKEKAWIKVDLGANYRTASVVITNRKDCCHNRFDDHVLETSTDNVNWTQCFRGVLPHKSGSFTEKCAAEARYVRARMINPEYLNLQEIEVRGTPLCGVQWKPHLSKAAPASSATTAVGSFVDIPHGANTQGKCSTCTKSFEQFDEQACLAAAIAKFGSKVTAKRARLAAGSWNHVPSGCSVQSGGDWAAHFNRKASPTNVHSSYTTVGTRALAPTMAFRLMNTQATLNNGWYRVMEITAKDANGNVIKPAGARSDTYHGAWRSSTWAPELYDDDKRWGNDRAIHFKESATVWFDQPVAIGSLSMTQLSSGSSAKYAQSGFKWQAYEGTFADAGQ